MVGRELLQHLPHDTEASGNEGTVGRAHQQWEGQGTRDVSVEKRGGPLGLAVLAWVSQNLKH